MIYTLVLTMTNPFDALDHHAVDTTICDTCVCLCMPQTTPPVRLNSVTRESLISLSYTKCLS